MCAQKRKLVLCDVKNNNTRKDERLEAGSKSPRGVLTQRTYIPAQGPRYPETHGMQETWLAKLQCKKRSDCRESRAIALGISSFNIEASNQVIIVQI